jgi:hypothetical protein
MQINDKIKTSVRMVLEGEEVLVTCPGVKLAAWLIPSAPFLGRVKGKEATMKLIKIGDHVINLEQIIEAHLLEDGSVLVTFSVTAFDVADTRKFSGKDAERLWRWLKANVEDIVAA